MKKLSSSARRELMMKSFNWEGTRRFLPHGYRVSFGRKETGHWHGGPPEHRKANCYCCKRPLRLVWSIDLADPALPQELRERFPQLSRLPLYYCFNCPEATTYLVTSDVSLTIIQPQSEGGDETPYVHETNVPAQLPRRKLKLARMASAIEGLLALESELGFDALDDDGRDQLSDYLGRDLHSGWDVVFSQFGGQPQMIQGHWNILCANPRCPSKSLEIDGRAWPGMALKELAAIEEDAICGFQWVYAPVVYHVCWVCGAIEGNFRCT